jgi:hypothetical protein
MNTDEMKLPLLDEPDCCDHGIPFDEICHDCEEEEENDDL